MKITIKVSEQFVKLLSSAGFTEEQIAREAIDITEFYLIDVGNDEDSMAEAIDNMNEYYNPTDID